MRTVKDVWPKSQKKMEKCIEDFKASRDIIAYDYEETKSIEKIIMIQLEGIDAVSLDIEVDNDYVMPILHDLKNKGLYLEHAYDQSGSGRTSDGEFLALASLLPIANESMYLKYSLDRLNTLPKILAEEGYATISIHGYRGSFYNRKNSHAALGFQESYFLEDLEAEASEEDYLGWGLSDEFVLNKVFDFISESEGNTFVHAIMLTNHHPFNATNEFYDDKIFENPESIVENYMNSVRYTDAMPGNLVKKLEESGIMEKTLLVIYSDHDSGITENLYGYLGMEYDAQNKECDRIPILLYDGQISGTESMIFGQADIAPMILSYIGAYISENFMGLNYIDGQKVVYKQGVNIYADETIGYNLFDMAEVTKSFVNYRGKNE